MVSFNVNDVHREPSHSIFSLTAMFQTGRTNCHIATLPLPAMAIRIIIRAQENVVEGEWKPASGVCCNVSRGQEAEIDVSFMIYRQMERLPECNMQHLILEQQRQQQQQ